ncbi:hypothetical protein FGW37_04215 [Streptomyces rectiverticillatus]|nr:hypothetical protein FGW37_04215 [Streptomyces rectiverticillatus]
MLIIGSVWKVADLIRARHDRVLRMLAVCLLLLTTGEILSFPEARSAIDAVTAVGVGKVVYNGVYMSGLSSLILFFAASVRGAPPAVYSRQVRLHTGLFAATLAALAAAMSATPPALRGHTLHSPHLAEPAVAAFYVIGGVYFVYAYLTSGLWALRYTRMASRHLALGLRAMTLGLFGLAITSVNRVIWVYLRIHSPGSHRLIDTVNRAIADLALGTVLIGLGLSAGVQLLTHLRSIARHRRMYQELTPLWTALSTAYPEIVLHREPAASRWDRFRFRRTHERFYRRLIECRDGLVRLSPYLTRVAPGTDLAHCPPDRLAGHITAALALKPAAEDPDAAWPAARVALPSGNDLSADAGELIALSTACARETREQAATHAAAR